MPYWSFASHVLSLLNLTSTSSERKKRERSYKQAQETLFRPCSDFWQGCWSKYKRVTSTNWQYCTEKYQILMTLHLGLHSGSWKSQLCCPASVLNYPSIYETKQVSYRMATKKKNKERKLAPNNCSSKVTSHHCLLKFSTFYWAGFTVAQRERAQEDFKVPYEGAPPHPPPIRIWKTATKPGSLYSFRIVHEL